MTEIEDTESPRGSLLSRPVRFVLHWTIKILVLLVLGIRAVLRPRPVQFGLAALVLAGIVAWNFLGAGTPGSTAPAAASEPTYRAATTGDLASVPSNTKLDRSPVVEQYLKAQSSFDAKGMWDVISEDLKQQLATSNTSLNDLQSELDAARQSGRRYGQAIYVGGVPLDQNDNAYFYVLTVDTPNGTMRVPYTYVVGSDGKINSIQ